jgi:hypothetical protein
VQEECRRIEEFSNYFCLKMAGKFAPSKGQSYRSQNVPSRIARSKKQPRPFLAGAFCGFIS